VPQRRGLGLGKPLDAAAQEAWAQRAVALFLRGAKRLSGPAQPTQFDDG
jgi:hypothetical protein